MARSVKKGPFIDDVPLSETLAIRAQRGHIEIRRIVGICQWSHHLRGRVQAEERKAPAIAVAGRRGEVVGVDPIRDDDHGVMNAKTAIVVDFPTGQGVETGGAL